MKELDDLTLKRAINGDARVFRKLYDYYSQYVWKIVFRTVNGDNDAAQQIVQNIFIKVYTTGKQFRFNSAFSTWLYRITFNEAIHFLRTNKKNRDKMVSFEDTQKHQEYEDHLEMKDMVSQVLEPLAAEERFLLVAREVQEIPFDDLAAITGKTSGALRTTLHRLKETIRQGFDYETGRVLSGAC